MKKNILLQKRGARVTSEKSAGGIVGLENTVITQPLLYIQTAEAVRNNRFGPPRHDEPDFNSPDYRRAGAFFDQIEQMLQILWR